MPIEILITLVAFATAIATAIAVPSVYALGIDHVTIPNYGDFSFIQCGMIVAIVWIVSNVISGLMHQTNPGLVKIDRAGSFIALASLVLTAVFVFVFSGVVPNVTVSPTVARVLAIPGALPLLIGLVAYALFDVLVIQQLKHRNLVTFTSQRREAAWARAHGMVADARTGQILDSVPAGTPGNPPNQVRELLARSNHVDGVVRKHFVIDEDNPRVSVLRGGQLHPLEAVADDMIENSPRQLARIAAYRTDPGSVPTEVIDLHPGDYVVEERTTESGSRTGGGDHDEHPAIPPGTTDDQAAAPRTIN